MQLYLEPIKTAFLLFPFLALIITLPYLLFEYHKYGSVPFIRSSIIYTFILYLLTAYFLIILPLPNKKDIINLKNISPQLIPFSFLKDFINAFDINNIIVFFKSSIVYTTLFNIALTMPFGFYLRYYFQKKLPYTICLTFILSLFFELTQLTGLYGFYDKAYRLFDVDDLIINTLGGLIGYIITPLFTFFLPNRNEIDNLSYQKGEKISSLRRLLAFLIDLFIFLIINLFIFLVSNSKYHNLLFIIIVFIYYIIIPTLTTSTIGKYIVRIKINSTSKHKHLSIFVRQLILYGFIVFSPFFLIDYLNINYNLLYLFYLLFLIYAYFEIFLKLFNRKKPLFYERITKTENISTILRQTKESSQENEFMVK